MPSPVRNLCANPRGKLDERVECLFIRPVASEDRELLTDELDDGRRRKRHRAFPPALSVQEHSGGLMPGAGLALHDEFGLLARGGGPHTDPPGVAFGRAPVEKGAPPHHYPRPVAARRPPIEA